MKKTFKILLAAVALSVTGSVIGQGLEDYFAGSRTLQLAVPTSYASGTSTLLSNAIVDIHGSVGISKVDFFGYSVGTGTISAQIAGSVDQTNWSVVPVAMATQNVVIYTNTYYGNGASGITATNTWNLYGTTTTPTAATAGFATPYIGTYPAGQYTNTGTLSVIPSLGTPGGNTNGAYVMTAGFNIADAPRYIRIQWSGSATNAVTAASLTTRVSR